MAETLIITYDKSYCVTITADRIKPSKYDHPPHCMFICTGNINAPSNIPTGNFHVMADKIGTATLFSGEHIQATYDETSHLWPHEKLTITIFKNPC